MRGSWKLIIIICVIALGGLVELLKSADLGEPTRPLTAKELKALDFQPYSRKAGEVAKNTNQKTVERLENVRKRVLQARNKQQGAKYPQQHSFNHRMPKAPAPPIKPGKGKKSKKKLANKKKSLKKRKNKKSKKKVAKKDEDQEEPTNEEQDFGNGLAGGSDSSEPAPVVAPGNPAQEKSDIPDADEWVRRVLTRPSLEETTSLIKYYQSNLITAEVFYYVVEQMVEDSNQRMRELGIKAASSTPSYRSFTILGNLVQTEPFGSSVRSQGNQALDRYTQLAYLSVLEAVTRSQESAGVREKALTLLVESARKNLAAAEANPPPNPTGQSTGLNPLQQRYTDILTTLEQMLTNSEEPAAVSTALQNAVDGIKSALSA